MANLGEEDALYIDDACTLGRDVQNTDVPGSPDGS
ncbi:hypothetical protein EVA_02914 [gut metagenome]|uniref:Uncharacterized protein n=1 Tax=gut metagenome TaxID=749906 RepID=J9GM05_9ZZZZ